MNIDRVSLDVLISILFIEKTPASQHTHSSSSSDDDSEDEDPSKMDW